MSKITVTVSGPVGAGKTTLCAKLQIILKHLGCDVEWKDGAPEANMGIEEWPNEFKTPIELVEKVIPTVKVYETYSGQNGWLEVSQAEYDRSEDVYERRIRRVPAPEPKVTPDQIRELIGKHSEWTPQGFALVDTHRNKFAEELIALVQGKEMNLTAKNIAQEPEVILATSTAYTPVGYMMKHRCGADRGFSWNKNDLQFSEDWIRVGLITEETLELQLQQAAQDYNERAKRWRDTFDSMHRRAMRAEEKVTELSALREGVLHVFDANTNVVAEKLPVEESTTETLVDPLKACPFCGGSATQYEYEAKDGKPYYVGCNDCGIEVAYAETVEASVQKWNTRHNEKE